jgi:hypothetical protein
VSWWPVVLEGDLDLRKVREAGYELYEVEKLAGADRTSVYLFMIDWSKGRAFFYEMTRGGHK